MRLVELLRRSELRCRGPRAAYDRVERRSENAPHDDPSSTPRHADTITVVATARAYREARAKFADEGELDLWHHRLPSQAPPSRKAVGMGCVAKRE